ncbi:hypothetical protein ACFSFY_12810 [Sporosarcina siberiensis]|uniref:Uncharacterized protein n=1 Tax=Sporosarcina siberiensis TaxID=1365606 RepID=A0ABW4SJ89_9BACL
MNKYNKNILAITIITIFTLILMTTWLDLNFGYTQILLIIAAAYAVNLNIKGFKEKQRES